MTNTNILYIPRQKTVLIVSVMRNRKEGWRQKPRRREPGAPRDRYRFNRYREAKELKEHRESKEEE